MNIARILRRRLAGCAIALCSGLASAQMPVQFSVGDCAVYREGGSGRLLKTPTYWLRGTVAAVTSEERLVGVCPRFAKSEVALSREEKWTMARAMPCVADEAEVRQVAVTRIRLIVQAWETPWSSQHGTEELLFRGAFLGSALTKGESIDIDATWLARCE